MIARVIVGSLALACLVVQPTNGQDAPPKKLSPSEQAVEDAKNLLTKARQDAKAPEDSLRIDLALSGLGTVPKEVLVIKFDKEAAFDSGLLRYKITQVQRRPNGYSVTLVVLNPTQQPAAITEAIEAVRDAGFYSETNWKDKFTSGDITTASKGGLPAKGEVTLTKLYRGKPNPHAKFVTMEFRNADQFVRVIVPADKLK